MANKQVSILTIATTIVFAALGYWLAQQFLGGKPAFDKQLMAVANEINQNCPIMVDSDTRLDNAIGGPGNRFTYNYTLVNFSADQIDLEHFINALRPTILNTVKTNPDMQAFRDNKVTLVYSYKDKDGIFLTNIKIPPEDYLGN